MSVSDFSFSDSKVKEGRFTEVVNAGSNLFHRLKAQYGHVWATFLASHIGFEDDEFDWEGVKPLGSRRVRHGRTLGCQEQGGIQGEGQ
jgi:hypothetical protein